MRLLFKCKAEEKNVLDITKANWMNWEKKKLNVLKKFRKDLIKFRLLSFRYWIAYNNILLLRISKNVFKYLRKVGWIILSHMKFHECNIKDNELYMKEFFKVSVILFYNVLFLFFNQISCCKKHFQLKLYKIWKTLNKIL